MTERLPNLCSLMAASALVAIGPALTLSRVTPRFGPLPPIGRGTATHVATSEPLGRRAARRARARARGVTARLGMA